MHIFQPADTGVSLQDQNVITFPSQVDGRNHTGEPGTDDMYLRHFFLPPDIAGLDTYGDT